MACATLPGPGTPHARDRRPCPLAEEPKVPQPPIPVNANNPPLSVRAIHIAQNADQAAPNGAAASAPTSAPATSGPAAARTATTAACVNGRGRAAGDRRSLESGGGKGPEPPDDC